MMYVYPINEYTDMNLKVVTTYYIRRILYAAVAK